MAVGDVKELLLSLRVGYGGQGLFIVEKRQPLAHPVPVIPAFAGIQRFTDERRPWFPLSRE